MSRSSTSPKNTAPSTPAATPPPHEKIAKLAYEKWCKQGCPEGVAHQNWVEAERELKTECSTTKPAAKPNKR